MTTEASVPSKKSSIDSSFLSIFLSLTICPDASFRTHWTLFSCRSSAAYMLLDVAFRLFNRCEHVTLKAWPEFSDDLQAVKSVRQNYRPTAQLMELLRAPEID